MPHHYEKHVLRKPIGEWPPCVLDALGHVNKEMYVYMQGPSEFGISGTLARWNRFEDLARITVPTLSIGAAHDTMDPRHMERMARKLPNGSYLHCPAGSHMAMWDDPKVYHGNKDVHRLSRVMVRSAAHRGKSGGTLAPR